LVPGELLAARELEDLHTGLAAMPETTEPLSEATARELFDRHYEETLRFFFRRGFRGEEARDLAQETFLRALRGIDSLRDPASARQWLFSIAMNVLRNELRRRAAPKRSSEGQLREIRQEDEDTVEAEAPDVLDGLLDRERRELLAVAVRGLPPQMRRALFLRFDSNLKYREVAAVMQVSIDTVKSQLAQARARLRKQLGKGFSDIDSG
jgi:RNA polymerase sigma-70 factor (ECF subfamily)